MNLQHDQYNNLPIPASKRLAYIAYVDAFDKLDLIPKNVKSRPEYERYLHSLRDYLASFLRRTQPLVDVDADLAAVKADFAQAWEMNSVPGWQEQPAANGSASEVAETGIWCPACQRSYAKQTVYDAHLTSKKHVKAAAKLAADETEASAAAGPSTAELALLRRAKDRPIALLEAQVIHLGKLLSTIRSDTKANVERRAALTDKERQQELDEWELREAKERDEAQKAAERAEKGEDADAVHDEEEDEARIYNPLKLPLGWDGKPIPYWLYKLHGLGVEYRCEICSDFVYMGRCVLPFLRPGSC